ncbi:MAG: CpsD/CapB family tyrosine-protein kinase, partial [Lentisphaerota bacterium]
TLEKNNHAIAEAFKILRANLEFMLPGKNKSKIVMFTSALPGEGKSTIIANLASSMCESGKKVLILDCDLRKPFMHKFFAVDNSKGLVSIIVGATPFQDTIHRNAHDKGLDLISSGPIPPNPTELLMTDEFKQLLEDLSKTYDYIFIDAPPTLNMADTTILGHLADATIFVITAGKTRIEIIKRCLRQLSQTNIEVSGILLNRFNIEAIKYNYYYYYHYHYHYNYKYASAASEQGNIS